MFIENCCTFCCIFIPIYGIYRNCILFPNARLYNFEMWASSLDSTLKRIEDQIHWQRQSRQWKENELFTEPDFRKNTQFPFSSVFTPEVICTLNVNTPTSCLVSLFHPSNWPLRYKQLWDTFFHISRHQYEFHSVISLKFSQFRCWIYYWIHLDRRIRNHVANFATTTKINTECILIFQNTTIRSYYLCVLGNKLFHYTRERERESSDQIIMYVASFQFVCPESK